MKIIFSIFMIMFVSIGIENEGPMIVAEGKICDVKLYDFCDRSCFRDCPKMFGEKATSICNFNPEECICRRQC
ncbi:hypothetical protein VIGAN_06064000 [Vigna angularis var. angularis]|uniref:Knottin scorpion toxin-like domain-containing protein n=1 Tax=Vigna angularis var. angularis TaxID=157739 RepID=A0A0S3S9T4_PHAAN|nr:hypothetical protein VIGAN_06064000 [Vigna angularis var. angularis]